MTYHYGTISKGRLQTCHPGIVRVFDEAIRHRDVAILCGYRARGSQNKAFREGKSGLKWPQSKHNSLPSRAVDAGPYPLDWDDTDALMEFSGWVLGLADALGVPLESGAFWTTPFDPTHFQLTERKD
jgi:hypothetical protein